MRTLQPRGRRGPSPWSTSTIGRRAAMAAVLEAHGEHDVELTADDVGALADVLRPRCGRSSSRRTDRDAAAGAQRAARRARRAASPRPPRGRGTGTCTSTAPTTRRGPSGWRRRPRSALATRLVASRRRAVGRVRRRGCATCSSTTGAAASAAGARRRVPAASGSAATAAGSAIGEGARARAERHRRCQRDGVRAIGPRLVLEHPAGEVAPAPRAGVVEDRDARRGRRGGGRARGRGGPTCGGRRRGGGAPSAR